MFNASITRKAVIRYLTIVMDFSSACLKQDLRPNRAIVMKDKISVSHPLILKLNSRLFPTELHKRVCRVKPFVKDFNHGYIQGGGTGPL